MRTKRTKTKNPVMVEAGKKAAETRRKNKEALKKRQSEAGKKAAETRRKNKKMLKRMDKDIVASSAKKIKRAK
jgi:hypothetical protein